MGSEVAAAHHSQPFFQKPLNVLDLITEDSKYILTLTRDQLLFSKADKHNHKHSHHHHQAFGRWLVDPTKSTEHTPLLDASTANNPLALLTTIADTICQNDNLKTQVVNFTDSNLVLSLSGQNLTVSCTPKPRNLKLF